MARFVVAAVVAIFVGMTLYAVNVPASVVAVAVGITAFSVSVALREEE